MDTKTQKALEKVLEYLWEDEKKHYAEMDFPNEHIFRDLNRLRVWLLSYQEALEPKTVIKINKE